MLTDSERQRVLGYRLSGHHLSERLPPERMLDAAGACAVQNTPPGSGALSLLARVDGLTPEMLHRALYEDRSMLEAWSMRASPHLFPTSQAAIFGRCLQPDDRSLVEVVIGAAPLIDEIGLSMQQLYRLAEEAVTAELGGNEMPKTELAALSARRIAPRLNDAQQEIWTQTAIEYDGMTKGEAMVRFALYVLGMSGVVCFAEHRGGRSPIALTRQWLGYSVDEEVDCRELVRRYLRCYGPSTERYFAEWSGVGIEHATRLWSMAEGEMSEVTLDGRTLWLLDEQMNLFDEARIPEGARLLPPHDPYLQQRDRSIIVPEPSRRQEMWKAAGSPGAVLIDGEVAGTWRPQKKGATLRLELRPHHTLDDSETEQLEKEANLMAPFRNVAQVEVTLVPTPHQ